MRARFSVIADKLASIAESQIGTCEDAKRTNCGEAIRKYQASDDYKPNAADNGYPWCAAFVDWCVAQLFVRQPPKTPAAFGLIEWGKAVGCIVFGPQEGNPQRGDIVVYAFSHCGIVTDFDINHKTFYAVEGNTNDQGGRDGYIVARRARNCASVKRFIRLPAGGPK